MIKAPGTIIDARYKVVQFRGQGSFGEVYEVADSYQGATVALKFLNSTPGPGGIWEEAQRLTELRGDYILPVWNADFDAGVPYIVTELATEGSADTKMTPAVPPRLAVKWTRAACRGAARTHDAQLLHRDIKPANLFLKSDDRAVLGDFGIACLMDANGEGPFGGTPETMAPEVAAGGNTSVASDVYSLGATAFALLAGEYAHTHPDPIECMRLVATQPPPRLRDLAPHVSQALAQRVQKAMARSPADRYKARLSSMPRLGTFRACRGTGGAATSTPVT